jgi:hypothetical protein
MRRPRKNPKPTTTPLSRGLSGGFEYPQLSADIPWECKRGRPGGRQNDEADQFRLNPWFPVFRLLEPPLERKRETARLRGRKARSWINQGRPLRKSGNFPAAAAPPWSNANGSGAWVFSTPKENGQRSAAAPS